MPHAQDRLSVRGNTKLPSIQEITEIININDQGLLILLNRKEQSWVIVGNWSDEVVVTSAIEYDEDNFEARVGRLVRNAAVYKLTDQDGNHHGKMHRSYAEADRQRNSLKLNLLVKKHEAKIIEV